MQHELKSAIRFGDFWSVFGTKGTVAMAWSLGALHAERIRQEHNSFPFLQITGGPGSGTSFLLIYLSKLLRQESLLFFSAPEYSTRTGRARRLNQTGQQVLVYMPQRGAETDFDWDEIRPLYNNGPYITGLEDGLAKVSFKGALIINGDIPLPICDCLSQRILSTGRLSVCHTPRVRSCSQALDRLSNDQASAFVTIVEQRQDLVFSVFNEMAPFYATTLSSETHGLDPRPAKNYGQLMALVDALSLLLQLTEKQHHAVHEEILQMIDFEWLPF